MKLEKIPAEQWAHVAEKTHEICFGVKRPPDYNRIDYALVGLENGKVVGYITVRENTPDEAYLKFGGIMPDERGMKTVRRYLESLGWLKQVAKYKRLTTYIGNEHSAMLKMAFFAGFRVIGVRNFNGAVLLEHLLDFEKGTE